MKYDRIVVMKDGSQLVLRNGTAADGEAVFDVFMQTHAETDMLLSYPDENSFSAVEEECFLEEKENSENEVEIVASIDGRIVGTAGIEAVGSKYKIRHRAEFGIAILKDYWRMGIGKELLAACVECARIAGYTQLELTVVGENVGAIAMYESMGFVEYGRNPRGFNSRTDGYQTLVSMRLEL